MITHPGLRGRGHGQSAVALLARRALEAGLVPQYRFEFQHGIDADRAGPRFHMLRHLSGGEVDPMKKRKGPKKLQSLIDTATVFHHEYAMIRWLGVSASAVCGIVAICQTDAQVIRVAGSDTLGARLIPALAQRYTAGNKNVQFEIAAEGSATAFSPLVNGTADLGILSRKATSEELLSAGKSGVALRETFACHDMIVVIVHGSNKVKSLTKEEIGKIFTGAVKDWKEVGGEPGAIAVYTRNASSKTYKDWQIMAMGNRDYALEARRLGGPAEAIQEVSSNPNGISYVSLASIRGTEVRVVAIDGLVPIVTKASEYAYKRACYYYLREDGLQEAKDFVAFAAGDEGRKIVTGFGFAPD